MANPQTEEGYTPIANEILEHISQLPLNGTQFRLIMAVWRYTYGFHCKSSKLSISFLSKATGIEKSYLSKELNKLIKLNIITVTNKGEYGITRELSFNKNYDNWQMDKQLADSLTVAQIHNSCTNTQQLHKTTTKLLCNSTTELLCNSTTNKNNIKNNSKENIYEHFEKIWAMYPKKKGKGCISDTTKAKLYKIPLEEWQRIIDRYNLYIKTNGISEQFIMYGSTFFNSGYIDYTDSNYIEPKESTNNPYKGVPEL